MQREPAEAAPQWTTEDSRAADAEGWNVFNADAPSIARLERDDEANTFPDDAAAWAHVTARAVAGSATHQRALAFIRHHNPAEYAEMNPLHEGTRT